MSRFIHPKEAFPEPKNIEYAFYTNQDGYSIRYASLKSNNEKAHLIHQAGLGNFIEIDHEFMSSLARRGISVTIIERCGEGGSERLTDHGHMSPALSHDTYVRDLHDWMKNIYPKISNEQSPTIMSGYCFGGLVMTAFASEYPDIADAYVLTSPLYGRNYNLKAAFRMASCPIPENDSYTFNAHDWSWIDAQEDMRYNRYTHDLKRGMNVHYWRRDNPELRQGGITKAGSIYLAKSMLKYLSPENLEDIIKPVTIISPSKDMIGNSKTHTDFAQHIENSRVIEITGARHGIIKESDVYRDQLLGIIEGSVLHIPLKPVKSNHEALTLLAHHL